MDKLKHRLEEYAFWLKTGAKIKIANNGKPTSQKVIRLDGYFFEIDFDVETGEPTGDFGWTYGSPITHVPIREFYTAKLAEEK